MEHAQIFPKPGWVEHDPLEIWQKVREVIGSALSRADLTRHDIVAVGITNQRETTVVWNRHTGLPVYNAIVWQDVRTQPIIDRIASDPRVACIESRVGLPLATYFSASKVAWILDEVTGARRDAVAGHLLFGTIDSWLLWNLTGGPEGGLHKTDVTNASRTLLMDLERCAWDPELLDVFGIPAAMMPTIESSSSLFGTIEDSSLLRHVPITGILGDQQAAAFGQASFYAGESKATYGTGNFFIINTGDRPVLSSSGLLTTVAFKLGSEPTQYALEGSIAVTGSLIQWLRDNLELIDSADQIETLAASVEDNGGVYIVPAFSGLFAPHWRSDARGVIVGLTRYVTKAHIARAALEATAFQTVDVVEAARFDLGIEGGLSEVKVDGGMATNSLLMQFQADILGVPVVRPEVAQTTALGAAFVAGLAVGFWKDLRELEGKWREDRRWTPKTSNVERARLRATWAKAVDRSMGWVS